MPTLLQRVRSGIRAGTALWIASAGCSDSMTRPEPTSDAGVDSATTLQPYPLSAVGCDVPDAGPLCCLFAECLAGPCPPAATLPEGALNGSLACGISGPFAPNPDDLSAAAGNCCYIVGNQVIDGRPLFVEKDMLVAPVVIRADWA